MWTALRPSRAATRRPRDERAFAAVVSHVRRGRGCGPARSTRWCEMSLPDRSHSGLDAPASPMVTADDVIRAWADWLVDIAYPYDFHTDPPVPVVVREPLVRAWFARDGIPESGETVDDWAWSCAEEGGWSPVEMGGEAGAHDATRAEPVDDTTLGLCTMCEQAPATTRWGFPVCQHCFDGLVETQADLEAMEADDPALAEAGRRVEESFARFLAERDAEPVPVVEPPTDSAFTRCPFCSYILPPGSIIGGKPEPLAVPTTEDPRG